MGMPERRPEHRIHADGGILCADTESSVLSITNLDLKRMNLTDAGGFGVF